MARQISVHSAAMTTFLRLVFFTASTTRGSCQVLIHVRLIGFCSGKTSCSPLISNPPRSSRTVVRIVGTPNTLAALAKPMTLFTTIVGSWLCRLANGYGRWAVMADAISDRRKHELGRQAGDERVHSPVYCVPTREYAFWLIERRIRRIEFIQRCATTAAVTLAEDAK